MKSEAYVIYCESLGLFVRNNSYGELSTNLNGAKKFVTEKVANERCKSQNEICVNKTINQGKLRDTVWVVRKVVTTLV